MTDTSRWPAALLSHITVGGEDECWPWTGYTNENGYGIWQDPETKTKVRVHRKVWELEHGPIPPRHVVDHTCHNEAQCTEVPCTHRACENPRHLEATTQSINSIRGRSGDHNAHKTHCKQGHEYTPENTVHRTSQNGRPRRACRTCVNASQTRYNAKRKQVTA